MVQDLCRWNVGIAITKDPGWVGGVTLILKRTGIPPMDN